MKAKFESMVSLKMNYFVEGEWETKQPFRETKRTHATDYHNGNLDYTAEIDKNGYYVELLNYKEYFQDHPITINDYLVILIDVLSIDLGLSRKEAGDIICNSNVYYKEGANEN